MQPAVGQTLGFLKQSILHTRPACDFLHLGCMHGHVTIVVITAYAVHAVLRPAEFITSRSRCTSCSTSIDDAYKPWKCIATSVYAASAGQRLRSVTESKRRLQALWPRSASDVSSPVSVVPC
jgi:hypothetical protein